MYNVYGSQKEFERVTRVFILHMSSLRQNRTLFGWNIVFAVGSIRNVFEPISVLTEVSCPYLAMDRSKTPRNCLSEVWYMMFTMLISVIRKYRMLPRLATV